MINKYVIPVIFLLQEIHEIFFVYNVVYDNGIYYTHMLTMVKYQLPTLACFIMKFS